MIVYEIPILFIVFIALGILGIGVEYIDTIFIICVVAYALFEMFFVNKLYYAKETWLKKEGVSHQKIKKAWFSMYACTLFRVLVVTIAFCLSLKVEVTRITGDSFFGMLLGWGNGIFKCLFAALCTSISWVLSQIICFKELEGFGTEIKNTRIVLFNIFQILSSLITGVLLIFFNQIF